MMNQGWAGLAKFSSVFLRLALGTAFLSAVADRFGLWGAYGQPNVSWGDYAQFVAYTAKLNWFLPAAVLRAVALIATVAEIIFGLLLILGWKTRNRFAERSSYDSLRIGHDDGLGSEGPSKFVRVFGRRGSAAPVNMRKLFV